MKKIVLLGSIGISFFVSPMEPCKKVKIDPSLKSTTSFFFTEIPSLGKLEALFKQNLPELSQDAKARLFRKIQPDVMKKLVLPRVKINEAGINFSSACISSSGQFVATGASDGTLYLWQLSKCKFCKLKKHTRSIDSVAISPDEKYVVSGSLGGKAILWDNTGSYRVSCDHGCAIKSVFFVDSGSAFITAGINGAVKKWSCRSGRCIFTKEGVRSWSLHIQDPSSTFVFTRANDCSVEVFSSKSGKHVTTLRGHSNSINSVQVSSDAKRIVTASADGTARVWNAITGECLRAVCANAGILGTQFAGFSPEGDCIVAGGMAGAKLWDIKTNQVLAEFKGKAFVAATFTKDGTWLILAAYPGALLFFNRETKKYFWFPVHDETILSLAFDESGEKLLTVSHDGTAKIWSLEVIISFATRFSLEQLILLHWLFDYALDDFSDENCFLSPVTYFHIYQVYEGLPKSLKGAFDRIVGSFVLGKENLPF